MSTDNTNDPRDPQQPADDTTPPAYQPPSYEAPADQDAAPDYQAPGYQPPSYQPPTPTQATGGYQAPGAAYQPPAAASGYQPPTQATGGYQAPGYQPPAQPAGGYQAPGAAYQAPQQGQPPLAQPYNQQAPQPYPGTAYPPVAPASGSLALWPTRALGGLIDYVAPGLVISLLQTPFQGSVNVATGTTTPASPVYYLLSLVLLAFVVYNSGYKQGLTGKSFGKQINKTRLVSEATGQPLGVGVAIGRYFLHIIDTFICFIGWLFPLWDPKRQTIADKLVKSVVVHD